MTDRFRNQYRIKSARLEGYDYSSTGGYFVTICTRDREYWFGEIVGGKMQLSAIGEMTNRYWQEIPKHFDNVDLDESVVMPNHVHGIILILRERPDDDRDVACNVSTDAQSKNLAMSVISPKPGSLGTIMRSYKSAVTRWCGKNSYPQFAWQSRFYDHIIRNEKSLMAIRQYIYNNPAKWEIDRENPESVWY
jgi:REP element-mobilizing transposase RayT